LACLLSLFFFSFSLFGRKNKLTNINMQAIGIDMSKDTFHAAFDNTQIREFKNTEEGITSFNSFLIENSFKTSGSILGVESTGIYHLLFCARMTALGWQVLVINPLLTSQMIASGLRMVKTDRKDARVIRQAVILGKGHRYTDTPEVLALKALVSERDDLVEIRGSLKRRMQVHRLRAEASGRPLYGSYDAVYKLLLKEIKVMEKHMGQLSSDTQQLLRSIPGIGTNAAAMLVAYIGDIRRFDKPEKLVAYIGIDPRVKQSGTSINGKGYITKRGSGLLRHMLYMSAFIAKRHNPEFTAYYQKKKAEGKHHTSILCALERKLIHCIWAVWKRGTPFRLKRG
jgi:transposase